MSETNGMQRHQQRKRAFADATAGMIGSLAAMLAFYPVDVWKTSLQANNATAASTRALCQCSEDDNYYDCASSNNTASDCSLLDATNIISSAFSSCNNDFNHESAILTPSTLPLVTAARTIAQTFTRLFRGLPYKIAHTIASSFTYWFVYSLLQTKFSAYQLLNRSQTSRTTIESSHSTSSKNSSDSINSTSSSVMTKLVLTAIAAMINTGITLPLDTISSRRQVASASMNVGKGESKNNSNIRMNQNQQKQTNIQRQQQQQQQQQLQSILSLWNGLLPALMLCSNPAIQHTLYDMFKAAWLVRRRYYKSLQLGQLRQRQPSQPPSSSPSSSSPSSSNTPTRHQQHSLSMPEAFACGMISKFIATMITYPLIRCKVMLMVSPSPHSTTTLTPTTTATTTTIISPTSSTAKSTLSTVGKKGCTISENGHEGGKECHHKTICNGCHTIQKGERNEGARTNLPLSSPKSSFKLMKKYPYPHSLPLLLLHIYKHDGGMRGVYRGCSLQLLHTVLKSALLMMVRERIVHASHRFFRIEE